MFSEYQSYGLKSIPRNIQRGRQQRQRVSPKMFKCSRCGRAYERQSNLTRHLRFECGQHPRFKCPYCDRKCKQRTNVYHHVRTIHPGSIVHALDIKQTH